MADRYTPPRCQTMHVPSGARCQYFEGHLQRHFARVGEGPLGQKPVEFGTARSAEDVERERKQKGAGDA
ncbi:MAG TPA: hypothetical protein VFB89_04615 [Gemmatimonadales bacterium]|nr:hypothetical protein [Gemmatimonadales bacterium]